MYTKSGPRLLGLGERMHPDEDDRKAVFGKTGRFERAGGFEQLKPSLWIRVDQDVDAIMKDHDPEIKIYWAYFDLTKES